jgi:MoxR-like ATPase
MNPIYQNLQSLADNHARALPAEGGLPASWHLWRKTEVNAIILALAAQRPLLICGEPGTGKSQLARAAKVALNWALTRTTLHARTEVADLLYQFDAVRRLADAQVPDRLQGDEAYWQPQALWLAFDWQGAHAFGSLRAKCGADGSQTSAPAVPAAPTGQVLLFDEIDKAPAEVPNGLLDVLGERRFSVPGLGLEVVASGRENWPLIIFTSNGEKDLPDAFVRRCVVLSHASEQGEGYRQFLLRHGNAHFGPGREAGVEIDSGLLEAAAGQLMEDRKQAQLAGAYVPGLAEYLDLLYALHELAPGDTAAQADWLNQLNQYAYLKAGQGNEAVDALRQDVSGARQLGQVGAQGDA